MTEAGLNWNLYKAHLQPKKKDEKKLKEVISAQHTLRRFKDGVCSRPKQVLPSHRHYWSYRDVLTCLTDSLLKVDKLIVPKMLQSEMLEKIHETHLGIVRCKSRARRVLLWPGMSAHREDCCSLPGV